MSQRIIWCNAYIFESRCNITISEEGMTLPVKLQGFKIPEAEGENQYKNKEK